MAVRNTVRIGDVKLTLVEELVMPTSARWMFRGAATGGGCRASSP